MEPLFLDNHILVLDKPWGLLTQPSGTDLESLEELGKNWLKAHFNKPGAVFLEAVHRIDRPVCGVVLFARTSKALSRLNAAQRARQIRKCYRAVVSPAPKAEVGVLQDTLLHGDHLARVVPRGTTGGLPCRLQWRVVERRPGNQALLEIDLETGRYHQIRCQLSHAGWPILNDLRYGGAPSSQITPNGIALCSATIAFPHPVGGEVVTVASRMRL